MNGHASLIKLAHVQTPISHGLIVLVLLLRFVAEVQIEVSLTLLSQDASIIVVACLVFERTQTGYFVKFQYRLACVIICKDSI